MKKSERDGMYKKIEKHGRDLLAMFPAAKITEPIALCKALRRLELKAHKAAENYCNGVDCGQDGDKQHKIGEGLRDKAAALLGASPVPCLSVFFNGDARGYALKIRIVGDSQEDGAARFDLYKDWGGYGIIALEPGAGRKTYRGTFMTETAARDYCRQWNAAHDPGRLSLKAEYEEVRKRGKYNAFSGLEI